jgi:polyhydroxyalkanoate synthesis repressor PhaR
MSSEAAPDDDESLMLAFVAGDAGAFEVLYDRHALPVWRFVQRSVQNSALADDLVQDVWFKLLSQAPHYEPRARWRTWLFTLAHHRLVDHWRTHKAHTSLDAETPEGAALAETLHVRLARWLSGRDVAALDALSDASGDDPIGAADRQEAMERLRAEMRDDLRAVLAEFARLTQPAKSGDDLTRQYLLQIIAEHESRGENVLPLEVLNDLVRSYTAQAQSVVPQFLAMSFDMLREGPSKLAEQMSAINPMMAQMSKMPGFDAMQKQQKAFLESMMAGWQGLPGAAAPEAENPQPEGEDLSEIRKQLAALEAKLSKMGR